MMIGRRTGGADQLDSSTRSGTEDLLTNAMLASLEIEILHMGEICRARLNL
jgi:hypothetical protein